ncbi:MAG: TOBE domain-containing protein [Candidatus Dormiibacterota bacterium]
MVAITESSLKRLKLKAGDRVTVIIKATDVLIGK